MAPYQLSHAVRAMIELHCALTFSNWATHQPLPRLTMAAWLEKDQLTYFLFLQSWLTSCFAWRGLCGLLLMIGQFSSVRKEWKKEKKTKRTFSGKTTNWNKTQKYQLTFFDVVKTLQVPFTWQLLVIWNYIDNKWDLFVFSTALVVDLGSFFSTIQVVSTKHTSWLVNTTVLK